MKHETLHLTVLESKLVRQRPSLYAFACNIELFESFNYINK